MNKKILAINTSEPECLGKPNSELMQACYRQAEIGLLAQISSERAVQTIVEYVQTLPRNHGTNIIDDAILAFFVSMRPVLVQNIEKAISPSVVDESLKASVIETSLQFVRAIFYARHAPYIYDEARPVLYALCARGVIAITDL